MTAPPHNMMDAGDILCDLIRIPSVNPASGDTDSDVYGEHRLSDWLEDFLKSMGARVERIPVVPAGAGRVSRDNILARYDAGPARPTILLDAHQDTVAVDGMSSPFEPRQHTGRIYGRGACDVKGGLAAMLAAFARLFRDKPANAANVVLSCSCDEEVTALGVRDLVTYWNTGVTKSQLLSKPPTVGIVAEPTSLHVVVAHRGVLRFRVHTQGTACHASDPSQGDNAIYAMAPVILLLQTLANELAGGDLVDGLCGRPALSVGLIHGGTAVNIVPAACVIDVDRRLIPGENPGQVWQTVQGMLAELQALCEQPWLAAPALAGQPGQLSGRLLAEIHATGQLNAREIGVPYCTNASTIAASGIPTVVFGPGAIAQAHTANEYIEVSQLQSAAEVYYQFCSGYAAA